MYLCICVFVFLYLCVRHKEVSFLRSLINPLFKNISHVEIGATKPEICVKISFTIWGLQDFNERQFSCDWWIDGLVGDIFMAAHLRDLQPCFTLENIKNEFEPASVEGNIIIILIKKLIGLFEGATFFSVDMLAT